MTYLTLCHRLAAAGIENATWEAQLLLEHFCGATQVDVMIDPKKEYASEGLEKALSQREEHYPLQYILGEWCFYRQTYQISPDCLIPRSDTEILVEEAIRRLPENAHFADLCTGSGCIAVSVLAERPDTTAVAVDKFPNTLAIAEGNAARNGVAARFRALCVDLLEEELPSSVGFLDAVLCNPPYIAKQALAELAPELAHEPAAALDGGEDGLIFYRHILEKHAKHLLPNGFFLFEIGFDQAEALKALGREAGFGDSQIFIDYGGNDRVVLLRRTADAATA